MNLVSADARRDAAVRYLLGRIDYERRAPVPYESRYFKLDRMRSLLRELDDPQCGLPVVHIAGSKGKGSVAAMIAASLAAGGRRVGLFTSPHLENLEERLAINGTPCSPDTLADLVARVAPAVERLDRVAEEGWNQPTFFEIVTCMAMRYFADQHVDACVLETGLGGRLDATNVCQPRVAVITSISRDHTQQLGESLEEIAREKAGIIKPGVPVVTGVTNGGAARVIEAACERHRSQCWRLGREFHCRHVTSTVDGTTFGYESMMTRRPMTLRCSLTGHHQAGNAAVAVAALEQWYLREESTDSIPWDAIRAGLTSASCPARFEVVSAEPPVVLDAAHNEASIRAFMEAAEECFPGRRWTIVFGTSADKEIAAMLALLIPWAERLIVTRYQSNPRGAAVAEVVRLAQGVGGSRRARVETAPTPLAAWRLARDGGSDAAICVTGSFFLAAELREAMTGRSEAGTAWDGRTPPRSDRL